MKGLFWEFPFFFLFLFTAGGEVGESSGSRSILPRAGRHHVFVILVRFRNYNYPPLLIICILRAPTQRTCSRLGRDGRERDESRV